MDIYISLNNRGRVIKLPYLPPEFTITSPQGNETYQTVNGELNLIGNMGLKGLSFSSFLDDWEIVRTFEELRTQKIPFRIIITEASINMAVTIDNFDYSMKKGKKIYYSLTLKEFSFGGV
ncbi:hypothetical protein [Anaerotignum sp. MB30-C6]|uniref:hypothetical protein n=1 Tax=Anaerotignum sp. MB30-C6 TaxID=3070814 RepID=UPI0027DC338A|nr:hypothetical protein [Anaerotignum sp. MB30-C6]WMI80899.1 hypothetical protein RBQ60_13930 [Anaerotignum sp. MB30-C6]